MPERMTSAERVMRVIRREDEPDRIPHCEWIVDPKVMQALVPGCTGMEEFIHRTGHDVIYAGPNIAKTQVGDGRSRNEAWKYIEQKSPEVHGVPDDEASPVKDMAALDTYEPPNPHNPKLYEGLERLVKLYKGKLAIGFNGRDVFSIPRYIAGYERLLMAIAAEPEFVQRLVRLSVDFNLGMAQEASKRGADFFFTGDDYAHAHGPLMSPSSFQSLFAGPLKELVNGCHDAGLPFIKHTDGDIRTLMPMIADAGIDMLDPIDVAAGMNLAQLKREYGQRMALKGGIDCAHLLSFGTWEEVIAATRQAIADAAEGGGYLLSSSNTIHSAVKPENYMAMLHTLRAYGNYPLQLNGWETDRSQTAFS